MTDKTKVASLLSQVVEYGFQEELTGQILFDIQDQIAAIDVSTSDGQALFSLLQVAATPTTDPDLVMEVLEYFLGTSDIADYIEDFLIEITTRVEEIE